MSARDRFKAANNNFVKLGSEANKETIVDDIMNDLNKVEEKSAQKELVPVTEVKSVTPVTPVTPVVQSPLIEVTDKSRVGRPKEGESQKISAKLKIENYYHARLVGGKYGGMTAYINYLIEQDRKREQ